MKPESRHLALRSRARRVSPLASATRRDAASGAYRMIRATSSGIQEPRLGPLDAMPLGRKTPKPLASAPVAIIFRRTAWRSLPERREPPIPLSKLHFVICQHLAKLRQSLGGLKLFKSVDREDPHARISITQCSNQRLNCGFIADLREGPRNNVVYVRVLEKRHKNWDCARVFQVTQKVGRVVTIVPICPWTHGRPTDEIS